MKKTVFAIVLALGISTLNFVPVLAAESPVIVSSVPYTASISKVGNIWKGDIPTKVTYPTGTYSSYIEFPINGLISIAKLRDGLTGVTVDFEIWNAKGKKIGYDTVYSSDWNPVGPDTLVSIYISESEAIGIHSLLIRTKYELSGNGLVTQYLQQEDVKTIEITKKPIAPEAIRDLSAVWNGANIDYSFTEPKSDLPILKYEIGIADSLPGVTEANRSFYEPATFKTSVSNKFTLTPNDLLIKSSLSNAMILIQVRAVSSAGTSSWSNGIYTLVDSIKKYGFAKIPPSAEITCESNAVGMTFGAKVVYDSSVLASGVPTSYIWRYRLLKQGLEPTSRLNYGEPSEASRTSSGVVTFSLKEMLDFAKSDESATILVTVLPSNNYGDSGIEGKGCYVTIKQMQDDFIFFENVAKAKAASDAKAAADKIAADLKAKQDADAKAAADKIAADLKAKQDADAKAAADLKAKQDADAKAAADKVAAQKAIGKKTTITCVKGKLTKIVTAVNPKCPTGYKKK